MAKNITIAEDGVSRNFTAKKLKTKLQGGGNCTWIPEDEAVDYVNLKSLKATQNGTYKASDSNCDGFDEVKVDVPSEVIPQKTITENGEYDAYEESGMAGYAHVSVNVSGGGGDIYAFARALYDRGQTVTATDGVTTLVSDTSGYYVFAIPNSGAWTFTSADESISYVFDDYGESKVISISFLPYSNPQDIVADGRPARYDVATLTWDAFDINGGGEIIVTANMPAVRLNLNKYAHFPIVDGGYFTAYIVCSAPKIYDEPTAYYYNMCFTKSQSDRNSPMFWRRRGLNNEKVEYSTYGASYEGDTGLFYIYDAVYTIVVNKSSFIATFYCNGEKKGEVSFADIGDFCVNGALINSVLSNSGILDVRYVALLNNIESESVIINNQLSLMQKFHIGSYVTGLLPYSDQTKIRVNLLADDYDGGSHWGDFDIVGSPSKITSDNHYVVNFGSGDYATLDIPATWNMTIYIVVKVNSNVDSDGRVFSMCKQQTSGNEPCVYNRGNLYIGTYANDEVTNFNSSAYNILVLSLDDVNKRWSFFSNADQGVYRWLTYSDHGTKLYLSSSINGLNQTDENIMYIGIVDEVETPDTIWRNIQALRQQLNVLYPA